jgi:hypothetical protein
MEVGEGLSHQRLRVAPEEGGRLRIHLPDASLQVVDQNGIDGLLEQRPVPLPAALKPIFSALLFGQVSLDGRPVVDGPVDAANRRNGPFNDVLGPILAIVRGLSLPFLPVPQCLSKAVQDVALRLRALQNAGGFPANLLFPVPRHFFEGVVGVQNAGPRLI